MFGAVAITRALNQLMASIQGPAEFLLTPTGGWWYSYGLFGGLCFSWFVVGPIVRWKMGNDRFARWTSDQHTQAGFDTDRALRAMAAVIMVPVTIAFVPSLGCHTRFSKTDIGIQGYADIWETRYTYRDVVAIAIIKGNRNRSGELVDDPQIVIDFQGGKRWSSGDGFRDPEKISPNLASFIAEKTGLDYRYVDAEEDLN